jgi:hypothetical protein
MGVTEMMDDDLEKSFAAARRAPAVASDDFLDRVMADALREQTRAPASGPARASGFWPRILASFGGGPVLAGLCTAAAMGLFIGYSDPAAVEYLTGGQDDEFDDTFEFLATDDLFATEG